MIVGSTLNAKKWSVNFSPNTKLAPASEKSRNFLARLPRKLNAAYPHGVRITITASAACRPIPHSTVRQRTPLRLFESR